jgi:hypothetical protein
MKVHALFVAMDNETLSRILRMAYRLGGPLLHTIMSQ